MLRTDGTGAGTTQIRAIQARPSWMAADGKRAFLSLADRASGRELFVSDGAASGTRLVRDLRPGLAGSDSLPSGTAVDGAFLFSADDGVRGRTVTLRLQAAQQRRPCLLGLGLLARGGGLPFAGGCTIPVDYTLPHVGFLFMTDAAGRCRLPLAVASSAALAGARIACQAGVGPTRTPPLRVDLSNGLFWTLGR